MKPFDPCRGPALTRVLFYWQTRQVLTVPIANNNVAGLHLAKTRRHPEGVVGVCSTLPCRSFPSPNAGLYLIVRFSRLAYLYRASPQHLAQEGSMKYEPTNLFSRIAWCRSRIAWCRLQQQLHSVTEDDRAGWRAEEAGLLDALALRDRRAIMREEHQSQFIRYQCGLEDGRALLRINALTPGGMSGAEGLRPATSTTSTWVERTWPMQN